MNYHLLITIIYMFANIYLTITSLLDYIAYQPLQNELS